MFIANPRRRKARRRHKRNPRALRPAVRRHRRRSRRNAPAVMAANTPRRHRRKRLVTRRHVRRHRRNPESHMMRSRAARKGYARRHHRRHRRNPAIFSGIATTLKDGAFGALGTMGVNYIANQINKVANVSGMTGSGIKLATALFVPKLLSKPLGKYANTIQTVAVAYALMQIAQDFLPTTLAPMLSVLNPSQGAIMPGPGTMGLLQPAQTVSAGEVNDYAYGLNN